MLGNGQDGILVFSEFGRGSAAGVSTFARKSILSALCTTGDEMAIMETSRSCNSDTFGNCKSILVREGESGGVS